MTKEDRMSKEICKKCQVKMKLIKTARRLLDRDEMGGMSDGEEADYIAAELGGDSSDFEIDQFVYQCPKCHEVRIVEVI
jgi:ssDNA-binding Zn-finger/Zn-ribbon topoisomerase 1